MLEAIHAFLGVYWPVVVAIVGTLFLCVPIYVFWEQIRYVLMCTRMRLPLFGTVSQWIKKPGQQDPDTYFLEGESTVCNTYYAYYVDHIKDRDFFRKCEDYLMKVGEQSRREKGMFLWTLLFVLMIIESSAFGFALAPFAMSHSVTPNMAVGGGFALGTLLSPLSAWPFPSSRVATCTTTAWLGRFFRCSTLVSAARAVTSSKPLWSTSTRPTTTTTPLVISRFSTA